MNERNLNEGQWEDRKQWSLGVGQRRKTFLNSKLEDGRFWTEYYQAWGRRKVQRKP